MHRLRPKDCRRAGPTRFPLPALLFSLRGRLPLDARRVRPRFAAQPVCPALALAGAPHLVARDRSIGRLALSRPPADPQASRQRGHPARRQHAALRPAARRQVARRRLDPGQAPGHEPYRLVQRYRHDRRAFSRRRAWLRVGRVRFDRQHLGRHGSLRGARRPALDRLYSRGQNRVGQAFAIHGLRRADGTVAYGFRRLRQARQRAG